MNPQDFGQHQEFFSNLPSSGRPFDSYLSQVSASNAALMKDINKTYDDRLDRLIAENRESTQRQDEAHQARIEEDRRRAEQELASIREEQRQRETDRLRRMEEERQLRLQAQIEFERRMAEESKARIGVLQSMKNFVDSKVFGRQQTATVEEIRNAPALPAPGSHPPQQQYGTGTGYQGTPPAGPPPYAAYNNTQQQNYPRNPQ